MRRAAARRRGGSVRDSVIVESAPVAGRLIVYIAVVVLQTVVLPAVSGGIQFFVSGGNALIVFGLWWAFWGVGTRLLLAGISQLSRPERTAQDVLGIDDPKAGLIVHELAYANLALGAASILTVFLPGWGVLGSLAGAIYLGLAGARHVAKRGKNAQETVATWTDLLVFVVVVAGAVATVIGGAAA